MLASIKNKTKGWVAYLIVGVITVPFALFGIHDYINNNHSVTVASVDGEEISGAEYNQQLSNLIRRAQEQLGDAYTPDIENNLRRQALDSLIDRKVLENIATSLGYATTNDEIKSTILTNEVFYKDGVFDLETYNTILSLNGLTPKRYEEELLMMSTITQLRNNLEDNAFLSDVEKNILTQLTNEQRDISFTSIDVNDFNTDERMTDITPSKIASYYEANTNTFTYPETITIDYITIDKSKIMDSIIVSEEELLEEYEIEKSRYQTEEERSASHILVEERSLAEELKAKLDAGESFESLAAEYSIDESNAGNGGSLGFFGKGVMVPKFEEVVFAMNTGEISTPVNTEFGYHIIKLDAISEPRTKPLAELRDELTTSIKSSKARLQMLEQSEQLQTLVYEQGLDIAAEGLGLTITTSEPLTRDSNTLASIVVNTAYSEEVRTTNEAVVIEVDENTTMALRKNTLQPALPKTLAEATAEITTILRAERARDLANAYANILVDENKDLDTSLSWTYRDDASKGDPEVINAAFATPKNQSYATHSTGDTILVTKVSGIRIQEREQPVDYTALYKDYSEELFNDITKYKKGISTIKRFDI